MQPCGCKKRSINLLTKKQGVILLGGKGKEVGKVMSFYKKIGVAAIDLTEKLEVEDTILIKGHTTNFEQKVDSMQIEHEKVEKAKKGD